MSPWCALLTKFQTGKFYSENFSGLFFVVNLTDISPQGKEQKEKKWLGIVYLNYNTATCSPKQQFPCHHKIHLLEATGHFSAPHIILLFLFNKLSCGTSGIQHRGSTSKLPLALYLWIPWKVLLAISTMPPVGRATTPTSPFPIPLKKPAAPSFLAPLKEQKEKNKCFHYLLNHRIKPLLLQGNCFVLEIAHSHWLHRVLLYKELCKESHPLLPGLLRHIT